MSNNRTSLANQNEGLGGIVRDTMLNAGDGGTTFISGDGGSAFISGDSGSAFIGNAQG